MLYHHLCNCQTVRHQKLQPAARLQSDGSNTSGFGWSSARLLLPVLRPQATNEPWLISRFISSWFAGYSALLCVPHSSGPLQTLDIVLDWVWPSLVDIRCLPCGLTPGQHLSQITTTLIFLSGVSGATLCWLLWSSLPSENLPRGSLATIHKVPCGSVVFVLNSWSGTSWRNLIGSLK